MFRFVSPLSRSTALPSIWKTGNERRKVASRGNGPIGRGSMAGNRSTGWTPHNNTLHNGDVRPRCAAHFPRVLGPEGYLKPAFGPELFCGGLYGKIGRSDCRSHGGKDGKSPSCPRRGWIGKLLSARRLTPERVSELKDGTSAPLPIMLANSQMPVPERSSRCS